MLLSLSLLLIGVFVTTPRLILLLLFANDFVTMSLADDRVTFSRQPNRWRIGPLAGSAMVIAIAWLGFCFAVFLVGRDVFRLDLPQLQTLVFTALVFTGQATVYLVRERRHVWNSIPGFWLMVTSSAAVVVVSTFADSGILMASISPWLILGVLVLVITCSVALDFLKIRVFQFCDLR